MERGRNGREREREMGVKNEEERRREVRRRRERKI